MLQHSTLAPALVFKFFEAFLSGFSKFFGRGLDRVHLIRATQLRQNVSTQTPQRTKYLYFARAGDKMSSQENYNLNCKNVQFCVIELNSKERTRNVTFQKRRMRRLIGLYPAD